MNYPDYKWIEGAYLKEGESMVRHIVLNLKDHPFPDWSAISETNIYTSIFRYADVKAVTEKHWKGQAIGDFYMDIDAKKPDDLKTALQFTRKLLTEINLTVPFLYIKCRFSGAKGFHIEIPFEAFGAEPSDRIHLYWKYIARIFTESVLNRPLRKGESIVDMGRYSIRQLWRLMNTTNTLTHLFKIPLLPREIMDMRESDILTLARAPRVIGETDCPGIIESARKLYLKAVQFHAGLTWWFRK